MLLNLTMLMMMKRIYESCVSDRCVRLPPMNPRGSYVGLNTPGGVQVDFPHTAGYIILGQQTNSLCHAHIHQPTVVDTNDRTYSVTHGAVGSKATDSYKSSKYETH